MQNSLKEYVYIQHTVKGISLLVITPVNSHSLLLKVSMITEASSVCSILFVSPFILSRWLVRWLPVSFKVCYSGMTSQLPATAAAYLLVSSGTTSQGNSLVISRWLSSSSRTFYVLFDCLLSLPLYSLCLVFNSGFFTAFSLIKRSAFYEPGRL